MHEATAVAVNSKDEVFVFNRGNMPVLVFDIEGNLIRHWGAYELTTVLCMRHVPHVVFNPCN